MEDVRAGLPGLSDRNAVVGVDDEGAPHPGMIHRWGSAFVEIDRDGVSGPVRIEFDV